MVLLFRFSGRVVWVFFVVGQTLKINEIIEKLEELLIK